MASTLKLHPTSVTMQTKSQVLTGVQDAYWSDEEETAECPLCLEEMDVGDLHFRPCPCGYQICRFCHNHIRQNLNNKCPACRREYSDEALQEKPVSPEDRRRLAQQKKQRERERKDLEALGRRHLANVRVVQRNVVYVVGIGPRFAKEELISTLRSNDYFGQYGRISKIVLVKRTPPGGSAPVVGLYITYHRREDAARCIASVDGTASPGGGNEVMRASYGTTKYCMAFLRGVSCSDHSCMNLHEWGDEKDCFTKEDLTTLQHAIKDTEVTRKTVVLGKKDDSTARLPRSASWANKPVPERTTSSTSTALHNHTNTAAPSARQTRRERDRVGEKPGRGSRGSGTTATNHDPPPEPSSSWKTKDPSKPVAAAPKPTPSRPGTPARSTTPAPAVAKAAAKAKRKATPPPTPAPPPPPPAPRSPTSSIAHESDIGSATGSGSHDAPTSADSPAPSTPAMPPGLTAAPPGLAPPPGLAAPPGLPAPGSQQPAYQMSTQVQALLNDVKARRELAAPMTGVSPFPDLDRTLQSLSEVNGFSFNLDPKLAPTPEDDESAANGYAGGFMDAFPGLRHPAASPLMGPPGLAYPAARSIYESAARASPAPGSPASYTGSFDPFAESTDDFGSSSSRRTTLDDGQPKMSRFGFARNGRQGGISSASSPRVIASPLSTSLSGDGMQGQNSASGSLYEQWNAYGGQHPFASHTSSPLAQHAQAYSPAPTQRFAQQQHQQQQQYAQDLVSEAALRELLATSRAQQEQQQRARGKSLLIWALPTRLTLVCAEQEQQQQQQQYRYNMNAGFTDPAIMSASFAHDGRYHSPAIESFSPFAGGPPGIPHPPPGLSPTPPTDMAAHVPSPGSVAAQQVQVQAVSSPVPVPAPVEPASSPPVVLSASEFPALTAQPPQPSTTTTSVPPRGPAGDRAAKKAAAAAERAERREARDRERAERRAEKAEKERVRKEREEEERVKKEEEVKRKEEEERVRLEKEREERERRAAAAREKAEAERKEKAEKEERERLEREKREAEAERKKVAAAAARAEKEKAKAAATAAQAAPPLPPSKPAEPQAPLLSKMPKKNKPVAAKPIRIPKESIDDIADTISAVGAGDSIGDSSSVRGSSRGHSLERNEPAPAERAAPTSLADLFAQLADAHPELDLPHHAFFDSMSLGAGSTAPLEHAPLVHALSALSAGGGSFAGGLPPGAVDAAVGSFQRLLETLTQTISDLLRLLPRTAWDGGAGFDGVLRDMLAGDDALAPEEAAPAQNGQGADEVAALTRALERRARWMEAQLGRLEALHRDINAAAVRAVLAYNDGGWDAARFAPRAGGSLERFDKLQTLSAEEMEVELVKAKEAAARAEGEVREAVEKMRGVRPEEEDWGFAPGASSVLPVKV
ncbi:hypothetical protein PENSPDRAFT_752413 [Peniophora sp. CONT]|nr:hypothetical protein PENSPDRAFT_752413 [Peniophora sp. CONT]